MARAFAFLALAAGAVAAFASRRAGTSSGGHPPPPGGEAEPFATRAELATGACVPVRQMKGVEAFRAWTIARWGGRDGGIWRECDAPGNSEHEEGRAWDWMCSLEQGRALIGFLLANGAEMARRAGVLYLIHDREIWRSYDPVWRIYTGKSPHIDHVHVSFSRAGAEGRTSFYQPGGEAAAYVPGGIA